MYGESATQSSPFSLGNEPDIQFAVVHYRSDYLGVDVNKRKREWSEGGSVLCYARACFFCLPSFNFNNLQHAAVIDVEHALNKRAIFHLSLYMQEGTQKWKRKQRGI